MQTLKNNLSKLMKVKTFFSKYLLLATLMIFSFSEKSFSQDVHLSQFFAAPQLVNPATTGIFEGRFRIINNYRNQWSSASAPYTTVLSSLDFPISKLKMENQHFGGGIMFLSDRAGDGSMGISNFAVGASYVRAVDANAEQYLSFGFQGGIFQRSIDFSKLTWDNQFNGDHYDPLLNSGEIIQLQQFSFLDFNAGLLYYYYPGPEQNMFVGFSVSHLTSPNQSFYTNQNDFLEKRYSLHGGCEFIINEGREMFLAPKFLVMKQGENTEINIGLFLKNKLLNQSRYTNYRTEIFFNLGLWYRMNDAFILHTRLDYRRVALGISYDFNFSDMQTASNHLGGPEFSFSWVIPYESGISFHNYPRAPRFF